MVKTNSIISPLFSLKLSIIYYYYFYYYLSYLLRRVFVFSPQKALIYRAQLNHKGLTAIFQSPAGNQYSGRQFSSREFF